MVNIKTKKLCLATQFSVKVLVLPTEILPSPPLIRYIRAKYLWSNEWWFLLALSASSRQKLRGIFLQFVSAVGGAGAVGMLTEYSTLPHFKNLARYILPQHTVSSSKKDNPIFFYHKVNQPHPILWLRNLLMKVCYKTVFFPKFDSDFFFCLIEKPCINLRFRPST